MDLVLWLSAFALFYAYAGYPLHLYVLTLWRRKGVSRTAGSRPDPGHAMAMARDDSGVSIVLAAHNEESRIDAKLNNLLSCHFPGRKEIVVVCDGCTDATEDRVQAREEDGVRLVALSERRGKASCLNAGLHNAHEEIVVFADVRQRFDERALVHLSDFLRNHPLVGAVGGELEIESSSAGAGKGIDLYWRIEKAIRRMESELDSCIGCSGAIYAIRRTLYQPISDDIILDDVIIPMQIALRGYQVKFEAGALAYDPQTLDHENEKRRKRRTLAGNIQLLVRFFPWLFPWRNRLWWKLLAHKYLRLAGPVFLALIFVSNLFLLQIPFYTATLVAQIACYTLALAGLGFPRLSWPVFSVPAGFLFLQIMCAHGLIHYFRTRAGSSAGW